LVSRTPRTASRFRPRSFDNCEKRACCCFERSRTVDSEAEGGEGGASGEVDVAVRRGCEEVEERRSRHCWRVWAELERTERRKGSVIMDWAVMVRVVGV
jgi:hypothetical protein